MAYVTKPRWTRAQIIFLEDNAERMTDQQIADRLGRTLLSVRHKRRRLEMVREGAGRSTIGQLKAR